MSAQNPEHSPQHGAVERPDPEPQARGYEVRDAPAGATYRAGLYILGVMFVVALLMVPLYWLFASRETRDQPLPKSVVRDAPQAEVAFPRLVISEPAVLQAFRRQEDDILNGYAWVEKDRGIARMPVAEAMRIVGARGALPGFPPGGAR
ncbi:MAG TPA: hypothetical protein VMX54_14190 [Vicinamibacteria bacterium]|nr:hypothetical protein [Vicinamibacteria bacterium]